MRRTLLLLVPAVVLVMTACGDDDDAADSVPSGGSASSSVSVPADTLRPAPDTVSEVGVDSTPSSGAPPSGSRGTADELAAIEDLAQRQGVDASAITVVSTDEVTWRDGSMGCPQPGMNYTQSLVPGTRVVLELDGARYEYHAGGARTIFLCENPQAPVEG
jgi:hypothetical protein